MYYTCTCTHPFVPHILPSLLLSSFPPCLLYLLSLALSSSLSPSLSPSFPASCQTHEDPNLGKVWFHGSITRDDAVELLMKRQLIFTAHTCACACACTCKYMYILVQSRVAAGFSQFSPKSFHRTHVHVHVWVYRYMYTCTCMSRHVHVGALSLPSYYLYFPPSITYQCFVFFSQTALLEAFLSDCRLNQMAKLTTLWQSSVSPLCPLPPPPPSLSPSPSPLLHIIPLPSPLSLSQNTR